MTKVVTMGEIMLRLSPPPYQRFVQCDKFDAVYGGGEANVSVSLANFGFDSYFVSKLPDNEIGQSALNSLRQYGVKTDYISRGGERIGIYFLEHGASMRPSKVIYDRTGSSISKAVASDFDFDKIFDGASWFHFTGITPAISVEARELVKAALISAKAHGVTVSADLNFRKKLWTSKQAIECMSQLMQYVDVCIGNEEDAEKCLGFAAPRTNANAGKLDLDGYKTIFKQMQDKFGFKYIAKSLRESVSANDNKWSALLYDGKEFFSSRKYDVRIVDRVGGGDSFAAGLIYGLNNFDSQGAIEFAVAASALKHTIFGDVNLVTVDEVKSLMGGDSTGRVQR